MPCRTVTDRAGRQAFLTQLPRFVSWMSENRLSRNPFHVNQRHLPLPPLACHFVFAISQAFSKRLSGPFRLLVRRARRDELCIEVAEWNMLSLNCTDRGVHEIEYCRWRTRHVVYAYQCPSLFAADIDLVRCHLSIRTPKNCVATILYFDEPSEPIARLWLSDKASSI